jgi:predicted dehydrogenase
MCPKSDTAVNCPKILVVGCGSIGQRHIRNLQSLGADVAVCDSRADQLSNVKNLYKIKEIYTNLDEALSGNLNGIVVCTPTALHVPVASAAAKKGCYIFVEKPLSDSLDNVDDLLKTVKKNNASLMLGFNLRFHPCLQKIKDILDEGKIGRTISAKAEVGQYLPDWHPSEDYRKSYSAQKALGGGIILDAIHEIDYVRWFLGDVSEVFCYADKLSHLEIDTEDIAEILLRFKSKAIGNIHMDYVQRVYNRKCEIVGDEGTVTWNFSDNIVRLYTAKSKQWQLFPISNEQTGFDFNQTYLQEMKCFIQCLTEKLSPPVDGTDGKRIQEIALAAKKSAEIAEVIRL